MKTPWLAGRAGVAPSAIPWTTPGSVRVDFLRGEYDVETAARTVEASELPSELADQLGEARGNA